MKQIINGLSWVVLTISLIWMIKSNFEWEPITVLIGSVITIISTFEVGISKRKLVGTWRGGIEDYGGMHIEAVTLFGDNNHYEAISKILRFPGLPHFCKIYFYITGEYRINGKKIDYNYSKIDVIYNSGIPPQMVNVMTSEMRKNSSDEIIHVDKEKLMTKGKNGIVVTVDKYSSEIDVEYFKDFIKELNEK